MTGTPRHRQDRHKLAPDIEAYVSSPMVFRMRGAGGGRELAASPCDRMRPAA